MNRPGFIRKDILVISLGILVLIAVTVVMTLQDTATAQDKPVDIPPDKQQTIKKESGLQYTDLRLGTGKMVKVGSKIKVSYTGKFKNGHTFDTNVGKEPYDVTVGAGKVIRGWEEGLLGMKLGGKRKLIVPPHLGYGDMGFPPDIPPKTELFFELEVVKIAN